MENQNFKNKNIEKKRLNNMQKKTIFKGKEQSLRKDFIELKKTELKDREFKFKREIEELFFKPIIVFTDDTDKFEQKEIKKIV